MIIGTIVQQPTDRMDYDIDCTPMFNNEEGDSVLTVTSSVEPQTVPALSAAVVKQSETKVKMWLSGGVSGTEYTVEIKVDSLFGRCKEDEILVIMEDF